MSAAEWTLLQLLTTRDVGKIPEFKPYMQIRMFIFMMCDSKHCYSVLSFSLHKDWYSSKLCNRHSKWWLLTHCCISTSDEVSIHLYTALIFLLQMEVLETVAVFIWHVMSVTSVRTSAKEKGKHNPSNIMMDAKIQPEGDKASDQNNEINLNRGKQSI